ncbi:hypothetical protein BDZ45DRAFT_170717 [Acephala macrosclerotiorum]|nr:hypothetical protein BDZ45DRAFT_170717 [Acephala macrosclerotiorum]
MRRKHLTSTFLFALPTADALSLANFQQITSILIPLSCQLTYDSQIPTCTKSDFDDGCSAGCISALNTVAQNVVDSCASITVNSNTLLGIVKNGGIVAALCPTISTTTSTLLKSSTTPIAVSPAVSVTIPTNSAGNTGGLGLKTTSATTTSIPATQSIVSTSSEHKSSSIVSVTVKSTSTKTTSTSPSSSTSIESADGGVGGGSAASTTTTNSTSSSKQGSVATSTSSATSKPAAAPDSGGTGGGSPFDISSGAIRTGGDSMLGMVILVMACILMR